MKWKTGFGIKPCDLPNQSLVPIIGTVGHQRYWAPALWGHHPKEIKDCIRALCFRPQIKQCFANCQRFYLGVQYKFPEIFSRLEYREGWAQYIIPIEHAWLTLDGKILDLTLSPEREGTKYLESYAVDAQTIRHHIVVTESWEAIDYARLMSIHPLRKLLEEAQRHDRLSMSGG